MAGETGLQRTTEAMVLPAFAVSQNEHLGIAPPHDTRVFMSPQEESKQGQPIDCVFLASPYPSLQECRVAVVYSALLFAGFDWARSPGC